MLKPIKFEAREVGQALNPAENASVVNNVFKVMHGDYGNLFLTKYTTGKLAGAGEVNARGKSIEGQDKGIISAREIWAHGLQGFSVETVLDALERMVDQYTKFPPNLGEFKALCKACAPRKAYRPAAPAIGMGQPLRSRYASQAREIVAKHAAKALQAAEASKPPPTGLNALKQAIADAVGTAGGNEAAELHRLDVMFAGSAA